MAQKIASYCSQNGCGEKTRDTYCEVHKKNNPTEPFSSVSESEIERHKPEIYKRKRWKNFRKRYLSDYPQCEWELCVKSAKHVDHIQPISEGGEIYDRDNCQALCPSHHSKKTARESAKKAQKTITQGDNTYDYDDEIDSPWI